MNLVDIFSMHLRDAGAKRKLLRQRFVFVQLIFIVDLTSPQWKNPDDKESYVIFCITLYPCSEKVYPF